MLKRFAAYKRRTGKTGRELFAHASGNIFLPSLLFWYDDINSLNRPKGDNAQIESMLRSLQSAVVTGLKHPYRFESAKQLSALYGRSNRLVRGYGISSCVVTPTSFTG